MPSLGSVYLRDISSHAASMDLSGNLNVNLQVGTVTASVSGQPITYASGASTALSGVNVIASITTNISGQTVTVSSGAISIVSGSVTVNSGTVAVSGLYQGGLSLESGIGGISGALPVALVAWDLSGLKWNPLAVSNSGLNALNTAASVSANISGQNVVVSSGAISVVSGSVTINSGTVAVSGFYQGGLSFESGIGGVSGAIPNALLAWDLSGLKWNPVAVSTSGSNFLNVAVLSGNSVTVVGLGTNTADDTLNIVGLGAIREIAELYAYSSGEGLMRRLMTASSGFGILGAAPMIYDLSGQAYYQWTVTTSGSRIPFVSVASGINAQISGVAVSVSGNAIAAISGAVSVMSGEIHVASGAIGANVSGGVTISGGVTVSGMVGISGNVAVISGAISVVSGSITVNSGFISVSGYYQGGVAIQSGAAGISGIVPVGLMAYDLSGANWGPVVDVISGGAGLGVRAFPSTIIRAGLSGVGITAASGVPSLSGGISLSSGDCNMCILRNVAPFTSGQGNVAPASGIIYVGGATDRPFSGFGFQLYPGDAITLPVSNFNQIYVFATFSGTQVSYIGTQF